MNPRFLEVLGQQINRRADSQVWKTVDFSTTFFVQQVDFEPKSSLNSAGGFSFLTMPYVYDVGPIDYFNLGGSTILARLQEECRGESEGGEVAGAEEGLLKTALRNAGEAEPFMPPRMIYTGIRVKDMDESIKFYTEILGMTLLERDKTPQTQGEGAMLKSPDSGQVIELNWYEEGSRFGTAYTNGSEIDHLGFEVENLGDWVQGLEAKGVKILVRPYEIGGWNEAFIADPNGIWIEFLQRK